MIRELRHLTGVISFALMLIINMAAAQDLPGFRVIYGNRDGSIMPVLLGTTIEIPVWGATPRNDYVDSVTFMHIPLSSNDLIITDRLGGYFADTLVGLWDDRHFEQPNPDTTSGWTNQSVIGFAYLAETRDPQNFFWTNGDTIPICTYIVRVSSDTALIGDTICPFKEGYHNAQGGLIWGMADGITGGTPDATYPCLLIFPPSSCDYVLGDANGDRITNGIDVIFAANYFKYGGGAPPDICACPLIPPPFYAAGDVNASCSFNGIDIVYMVNFYKGGPAFRPCQNCPPVGGR